MTGWSYPLRNATCFKVSWSISATIYPPKEEPWILNRYNVSESFLGFVGYHWRFIKHFAKISRPLYDMLKGWSGGKKRCNLQKQRVFLCEGEYQRAVDILVNSCCTLLSSHLLTTLNLSLFHTDASGHGFRCSPASSSGWQAETNSLCQSKSVSVGKISSCP